MFSLFSCCCIDNFKLPERQVSKPLRMCVSDVFKGMGSGFSVAGVIHAGAVQPGDRLLVMPQGELLTVKGGFPRHPCWLFGLPYLFC